MANIELSQEYENLKNEIKDLEKIFAEEIFKRDELEYKTCKYIKTKYMVEIGGLEYEVYSLYCKYRRLRRKAELIQIRKYRRERVDLKAIDISLDHEFADYQKRLDSRADEITKAVGERGKETMSADEVREFKGLYRKLIKKLHPDLHPDQAEDKIELFHKVVEAYKAGDTKSLKVIDQIVEANTIFETKTTMEGLADYKAQIIKNIGYVKNDIQKLKTTTPYIWKEILDDPIKKAEKIAELKEAQKSFKDAIDTLEEIIKKLLEETDDR